MVPGFLWEPTRWASTRRPFVVARVLGTRGATICLNEPDSFVAPPEIQPWLGLIEETSAQRLVISNHPDIINLWAPKEGLVFKRQSGGPIRVEKFAADRDEPLTEERMATLEGAGSRPGDEAVAIPIPKREIETLEE